MTNGIRKTRAEAAKSAAVDHMVHVFAADYAAIARGEIRAIVLRWSLYAVGDTLIFCEVGESGHATGAQGRRMVTHIASAWDKLGHGLRGGYAALSLGSVPTTGAAQENANCNDWRG